MKQNPFEKLDRLEVLDVLKSTGKKLWYIGRKQVMKKPWVEYELFYSRIPPDQFSYGDKYVYVIGPFPKLVTAVNDYKQLLNKYELRSVLRLKRKVIASHGL